MKNVRLVIFAILFASTTTSVFSADFIKTNLGSCSYLIEGIDVGTGRNDGNRRVYVSDDKGAVYEFSYTGIGWQKIAIGSVGSWGDGIALGTGRNDGITRVYSCSRSPMSDGHIDEFSYQDGTWMKTTVGTGGRDDVIVGDGRNDGIMRVYGANDSLYEYTWQGTTWEKTSIGDVGFGESIAVGSVRNNGLNNVYSVGSSFWEFSFENDSWNKFDIGFSGTTLRELSIGEGRGDGIERAYAAADNGHIYEFSYSDVSGWQTSDIGYAGGLSHEVVIGDLYGDGISRVYANGGSSLTEFLYNGTNWISQTIGTLGNNGRGLAIGDGRSDAHNYLYAGDVGSQVYEFAVPEPATLLLLGLGGLILRRRHNPKGQ